MMSGGIISAVFASLCWATAPALISTSFRETRSVRKVITIRTISATIFLGVVVLLAGGTFNVSLYDYLLIMLAAIIGPGLGDYLYFYTIRSIGSSKATPIAYTYIIVAQLLAKLFLGEHVDLWLAVGGFVSVAGIYIGLWSDSSNSENLSLSLILVLASIPFLWATSSIILGYLVGYLNLILVAFIRTMFLSIVFSAIVTFEGSLFEGVSSKLLLNAGLAGFIGIGMGTLFFLKAIQVIGVAETVIVSAITPLVNQVLSKTIAYEKITVKTLASSILVFASIFIAVFF